jgi:acetyl esterase/lipase
VYPLTTAQARPAPGPAHVVDVKRTIAWLRVNIGDYGGDPEFIAVTGGSAGGHLCSLAALTANDPSLQPLRMPTPLRRPCRIRGSTASPMSANCTGRCLPFLQRVVMQERLVDNPDLYKLASPIFHTHRDAPPFFVLHCVTRVRAPSHMPNCRMRRMDSTRSAVSGRNWWRRRSRTSSGFPMESAFDQTLLRVWLDVWRMLLRPR